MADDQTKPIALKLDYFLASTYCSSDLAVDVAENLLERECRTQYVHESETRLGSRFRLIGTASQRSVYVSADDETVAVTDVRALQVDLDEIRTAMRQFPAESR